MAAPATISLGGEDLVALLLPLGGAGAGAAAAASVRAAREAESRHEIVALLPGSAAAGAAGWHLLLNYRNWNAARARADEEAPTMVLSFLGDTEVGKSHTIRELMGEAEERPFVQRGSDQRASTTNNVNLFECRSLVSGVTVNMLDFEGENGSEATVIGGGSGGSGTLSAFASSSLALSSASSSSSVSSLPSSAVPVGAALTGTDSRSRSSSGTSLSGLTVGIGPAGAGAAPSAVSASLLRLVGARGSMAGGGAPPLHPQGPAGGRAAGAGAGPTPFPVMSGGSAPPAFGKGLGTRAEAVREFFPRLAYTTSDVVVMVGTEPFFSTRYLERVIEFAKRANAGVSDVDLPLLLLISNKRDGDRCVLDIQQSTQQFIDACGDAFCMLDQFFSALVCVYLPNKRNKTVDEAGVVFDGAEMFALQVGKLKRLLAALMRARLVSRYEGGVGAASAGSGNGANGGGGGGSSHTSRLITSKQGLWYELVPRVVRELNGGRPVHVTRLVDESWAAAMARTAGSREAANDILKSFLSFLRPSPALSAAAVAPRDQGADLLLRHARFRDLCLDVAVRVAACRLRGVDAAYRLEARVRGFARAQVEAMRSLLDDVAPCRATYGVGPAFAGSGAADPIVVGTAVERPAEPVRCLQEARMHAKGHRAARRVRGGGRGVWQRIVGALVPYTPAWEGAFEGEGAEAAGAGAGAARDSWTGMLRGGAGASGGRSVEELVADVVALTAADETAFVRALAGLAHRNSYCEVDGGAGVAICFAPLAGAPLPASLSAPAAAVAVRAEPLASPTMPYCIGCGDKATWAAESGATAAEVTAAVPAAGAAERRRSWLQGLVADVLVAVGVGTGAGDGAAAAPRPGAGERTVSGGAGTAEVVQQVVLGLCAQCVGAVATSGRG